MPASPRFFATPEDFRRWLSEHHAQAAELVVGFYKRGSGKPSISWPESVDEALSFGWIDGVRRRLSDEAYCIRFTPRKASSIWSAVNVARIAELDAIGKLTDAGRRAFAARKAERTGVYSHERNAAAVLSPADDRRLQGNAAAATFLAAQPPWYRRTATHWVISAKREETRQRRLDQLIADSAAERWITLATAGGRQPSKKTADAAKPAAALKPTGAATSAKTAAPKRRARKI